MRPVTAKLLERASLTKMEAPIWRHSLWSHQMYCCFFQSWISLWVCVFSVKYIILYIVRRCFLLDDFLVLNWCKWIYIYMYNSKNPAFCYWHFSIVWWPSAIYLFPSSLFFFDFAHGYMVYVYIYMNIIVYDVSFSLSLSYCFVGPHCTSHVCVCHPIFSLATALAYHMAMQTVLFWVLPLIVVFIMAAHQRPTESSPKEESSRSLKPNILHIFLANVYN